jgi:hypothetical protein
MKKAFIVMLGLATALSLTGCTLFYPNSGSIEDGLEPTSATSEAPAESAEPEQSPSPSPSNSLMTTKLDLRFDALEASGGSLLVVAEILNLIDDGGTCTLNYYQGSSPTVIGSVKAERNVTTTQCSPFNIDLASLPKGALQLTVSYSSDNHIGESDKFEVNIP